MAKRENKKATSAKRKTDQAAAVQGLQAKNFELTKKVAALTEDHQKLLAANAKLTAELAAAKASPASA